MICFSPAGKGFFYCLSMSDWIKIHRSVLDSFCFANPDHFKVWVWMLLKANYKKSFVSLKVGKGNTTIEVDRGQFIFGRNKAQEELKINGSMVYRILQKFEELEQIKIEPNSQYSIITICKYNTYQSVKDKDEQPMNNQRTTNEQRTNSERTTDEHIKEELEYKESKEELEERAIAPDNFLVPQMFSIFKKFIPTYPGSIEKDFKPLGSIANFLLQQLPVEGNTVSNQQLIIQEWEKICPAILNDNFYRQKSLSVISNQIQEIFQISKNGATVKPVDVRNKHNAGALDLLAKGKQLFADMQRQKGN